MVTQKKDLKKEQEMSRNLGGMFVRDEGKMKGKTEVTFLGRAGKTGTDEQLPQGG